MDEEVWKDGDPERRSMPAVPQAWLIGIMTAVIGALLSIGYMNILEQQGRNSSDIQVHDTRIGRLEENKGEVVRRLDSMDNKLDRILGWKTGGLND